MFDASYFKTVMGSFGSFRLHMKLGGPPTAYDPEGDLDPDDLGTWVHEATHFHQTLFTAFGQITWELFRQVTSAAWTSWMELPAKPDWRRGVPLAHAGFDPSTRAKSYFSHKVAFEMVNLLRGWQRSPQSGQEVNDLGMTMLKHPWAANPTVTVDGNDYFLRGEDILEGHAKFVEATFLESVGAAREEIWDHDRISPTYWLARDWFLSVIGEERYGDFPFVCDLALQTSLNPLVPRSETEWQEISPSWRFFHLTHALSKNPGITMGRPAEWPSTYKFFHDTLIGFCGYKSLAVVFSERLEAVSRRPQRMHLEEMMAKAISYRLEQPWATPNPVANLDQWKALDLAFPVPLVQIEGRPVSYSHDQDLKNELFQELQFQAFALQILGSFSQKAISSGCIECAYSRFGIEKGCKYQEEFQCPGIYRPSDGTPYPVKELEDGSLEGCHLEMILLASGIRSQDLDLDVTARFPPEDRLEEWVRGPVSSTDHG